ncbi:MAG: hypothetical protein ABIK09_19145 [Pseudomonadota bacterium]
MSRRIPRPGAGFLVITVGWILVVAFLAWGLSTPLLDRVWRLTERMQAAAFRGLTGDEVADLEEAVGAHPDLGREILGRRVVRIVEPAPERWSALGRQHLLVSEGWRGDRILEVQTDLPPDALPLELHLTGPGVDETVEIEALGVIGIPVQLPTTAGPILLRVRLDPAPPASCPGRGLHFDGRVPEVTP